MKISLTCFVLVAFTIAGCQPEEITATDYISETTVHSDDQARFSSEIDAIANDINLAIESTAGFTGRSEDLQSLFCDADITIDTISNPRRISITFNGTNCLGSRTRTGTISVSIAAGMRWRNPGAILQVSIQNLKITRLSDNKHFIINGD